MGAYLQKNRSQIAADMERCFKNVSTFEGARDSKGGHALGRRTANAGDGPRADVAARLLLLDEPSLGLAPLVVHTIFEAIDEIRSKGTTILLVEQKRPRCPSNTPIELMFWKPAGSRWKALRKISPTIRGLRKPTWANEPL